MPKYMIVYSFTKNNETIHNSSLIGTLGELKNAVSIVCGTLKGKVAIYWLCTENNNTFYKYRYTVTYTVKGGA